MRKAAVWLVAGLFLMNGCASAPEPRESPEPAASAPVETSEPETFTLPDGYPVEVPIAELPEHMQWAFEDDGTDTALAVADGLWAHLTPGATHEDAINSLNFDGFCSSKEAFEREYLNGAKTSGMCW